MQRNAIRVSEMGAGLDRVSVRSTITELIWKFMLRSRTEMSIPIIYGQSTHPSGRYHPGPSINLIMLPFHHDMKLVNMLEPHPRLMNGLIPDEGLSM